MTRHTYGKAITGFLVIDPYNDLISEAGKIWDHIRVALEAKDCVPHVLQVLNAARKATLWVFYALHHRYRPATTRLGSTLRSFRRQRGCERSSNQGPQT
jgi:ureidoacrylate peracid hydrolase